MYLQTYRYMEKEVKDNAYWIGLLHMCVVKESLLTLFDSNQSLWPQILS